jgi:hypothetical protein
VKKASGNKVGLLAVVCALLLVVLVMTGCGGKADAASGKPSPAASSSASAGSKTTTPRTATTTKASAAGSTKTTPTATPKALPKLTDTAFTLTLPEGQDYTENTIPIYLRADQTLHMNWLVVKGGDHFHMTFSLPNGNLIAVGNTGNLTAYGQGETTCENLTRNHDLVFRPEDNDWQDGYYLFHPQLQTNDQPVTIKILFWIE